MNNLAARYALMSGFDNLILALSILIVGSLAVMIALALIAWVSSLLEDLESSAAAQPQPPAEPDAAATHAASDLDPTVVAVITAAVTALLSGRRFRIQQIRMAGGSSSSAWGQAGRQSIHASHAIERKTR